MATVVDASGATALHVAVREDSTLPRGKAKQLVQVLLDHRVDIDVLSNDGYAPLHEAAASTAMTELLLDNGANPRIQNPTNGIQPIHMAARQGVPDVCHLLISAGIDVNAISNDGLTPLHEAAQHAQAEVIELLVAHGAACMAQDKQHKTPLSTALTTQWLDGWPFANANSEEKLVATVSALLSHGAGTRKKKQAWPELTEAAFSSHAAVVKLLLDKGAPASSEALNAAAQRGCVEVMQLLIGRRGDARQPKTSEPNALHLAARFGHTDVIRILIENGAGPSGTVHSLSACHDMCASVLFLHSPQCLMVTGCLCLSVCHQMYACMLPRCHRACSQAHSCCLLTTAC